jgi:hypothetical protein
MLDIPSHCSAREQQLKDAGIHIDEVLGRAGVDRSSWTGWKCRNITPRLDKWLQVDGEIERALEAAKKGAAA